MLSHPAPLLHRDLSAIGLGTWQLGADWGDVSEQAAHEVLAASVAAGVTLFDTADVYGDGRSERLIAAFVAAQPGVDVFVATKLGRRLPQLTENYSLANFRSWTDRSRANLAVETLDLVQLHCPPTEVLADPVTADHLNLLVDEGAIAAWGASVETCEQALLAIDAGASSLQIILNPFRLKPLEEVLPRAQASGVAVLARVPLASGLLSGRYTASTEFAPNDHRTYNRHGEAFDQGETFSGVDFATGVQAAQELAASLPDGVSLPTATLAWIASRPGVTSVIPGARSPEQATANAAAADLLATGWDLSAFDAAVHSVYDRLLRADIHPRW